MNMVYNNELNLKCCGSLNNKSHTTKGVTLHLLSDSLCCDYDKLGYNPTNAPQMGWGNSLGSILEIILL